MVAASGPWLRNDMNQGVQETEVELIRGIPETLHQQLHEAVTGLAMHGRQLNYQPMNSELTWIYDG